MLARLDSFKGFRLWLVLAVAIFCEAAWLAFLAPTDITHYACYGLTFWLGGHATTLLPPAQCGFLPPNESQAAFHMLPLEYPPLTLLVFSLPLLLPIASYALGFALLMTLVVALIYWLLVHSDAPRAAPIFLLYLLLGTATVAQVRFDLLPAACTLVCVLAAERGRWRIAYLSLAVGVLLKLYPIIMLPSLFLAEQQVVSTDLEIPASSDQPGGWLAARWGDWKRWHWRNSLLFFALLLIVTGAFALLNYQEAIMSPLSYFLQRPPQIESLVGSSIWASGFFGVPYGRVFTFGSLNLTSGLTVWLSPLATVLALAGLAWTLWLQWRERIDFAQAAVALVCVLLTTGKVFSPQYLIWLFPLLAYAFASGRTNRAWIYAWGAISLLTTFIYIFYYSRLLNPLTDPQVVQTLPGFFALVALRNGLLLLTSLAFFFDWWGTRQRVHRPVEEPLQV